MSENLQILYQGLVQDGYYDKTFEEFQTQMKDDSYRQFLYSGVVADGDFVGDFSEFESTFHTRKTNTRTNYKRDNKGIVSPPKLSSADNPVTLGVTDFYRYPGSEEIFYKRNGKEFTYDPSQVIGFGGFALGEQGLDVYVPGASFMKDGQTYINSNVQGTPPILVRDATEKYPFKAGAATNYDEM